MSPRGIAIPDVRRRLFDAASRVLRRDGAGGLSSRAVTSEAGTATGLLFRHFADFDAFLADFVMDQLSSVHGHAASWLARAGTGTVAGNLVDAALSIAPAAALLVEIVHTRPALMARLLESRHEHAAGIDDIERSFAAYLDAERRLGRIDDGVDVPGLATAVAASVHQLALRASSDPEDLEPRLRRVMTALVTPIISA